MSVTTTNQQPSVRRDLVFYFVANVLPMVASIVGMAWALRLVSPQQVGIFSLVAASASLATTSLFHPLCQWVLRYASRFVSPESRAPYWRTLWRVSGGASLLLLFVALAVALLRPALAPAAAATLLLSSTLATQSVFTTLLQGATHSRQYTTALAASSLLRWLSTIVLCYLWRDPSFVWWALVLGQFLGQLLATFLALRDLSGSLTLNPFSAPLARVESSAWSYGAPFLVWAVSMQLLNVADRYILQGFFGAQQVGTYSALYNLSNAAVMMLTNPILLAFTPHLFRRAADREHLSANPEALRLAGDSLQLLLLISAPLLALSALLHREIAALVLGVRYADASAIFPVLVAGILLWQFSQILQKGFEIAADTRALGLLIVSAVAVNLLLNFLLVPLHGILGAAWATVGAYAWYLAALFLRVSQYGRPPFAWRSLLKIACATLLSSGLLAAFIFYSSGRLLRLAAAAFSLLVYALCLLLLKERLVQAQFRELQRALGAK